MLLPNAKVFRDLGDVYKVFLSPAVSINLSSNCSELSQAHPWLFQLLGRAGTCVTPGTSEGAQQWKPSFKRSPERHRPRWLPLLRAPDLSSTTAWLGLLPSWKPALDKPKPSKILGSCLASPGASTPVPQPAGKWGEKRVGENTGEKLGKGRSLIFYFL